MESENYNKLVNKKKGSRLTDKENKLVVARGRREGKRSNVGLGGKVIVGLHEIMCVRLENYKAH